MNLETSNIAFNKVTKQFAVVLWYTNAIAKTNGNGGWPHDEYIMLTVPQARALWAFDEPDSSWSSPSEKCIQFVFEQ